MTRTIVKFTPGVVTETSVYTLAGDLLMRRPTKASDLTRAFQIAAFRCEDVVLVDIGSVRRVPQHLRLRATAPTREYRWVLESFDGVSDDAAFARIRQWADQVHCYADFDPEIGIHRVIVNVSIHNHRFPSGIYTTIDGSPQILADVPRAVQDYMRDAITFMRACT